METARAGSAGRVVADPEVIASLGSRRELRSASKTGFAVTSSVYQTVIRQLIDNATLQALGPSSVSPNPGGVATDEIISEKRWGHFVRPETAGAGMLFQ